LTRKNPGSEKLATGMEFVGKKLKTEETKVTVPVVEQPPEKPEKKLTLIEQVRLDVGLVARDPMSSDPNAYDIGERGDSGYKPSRKRNKKDKKDKDKTENIDKN
jgi:hypothetical protein